MMMEDGWFRDDYGLNVPTGMIQKQELMCMHPTQIYMLCKNDLVFCHKIQVEMKKRSAGILPSAGL